MWVSNTAAKNNTKYIKVGAIYKRTHLENKVTFKSI